MNQHPFEAAGLGTAPFKLVGFYVKLWQAAPGQPLRAGSSCDYCGTAIANCYEIQSADGKRFKVGSDCVHKVTPKGDPLRKAVDQDVAKRRREHAAATLRDQVWALIGRLNADEGLFADMPHPTKSFAEEGRTFREWAIWMLQHGGDAGKRRVLKAVSAREEATP